MIYLGTPGRMVGISCPAEQRLETAERYSFQTTLEGRVKAQVRPGGRRSWDLRLPRTSTPSEVATLAAFANGSWGPGPFWFVSADAPVVNHLSPAQASLDPSHLPGPVSVSLGGPMHTVDGLAPRSWLHSSPGTLMSLGDSYIPVVPGKFVTASAYLNGPEPRVSLYFYDSLGNIVRNHLGPSAGASSDGRRFSVTTSVPVGAVSCRIRAQGVSQAARPAITWTDQVFEWGDGQGCEKAVVLGGQRNLIQALDIPTNGRYADYSFTVQEVG